MAPADQLAPAGSSSYTSDTLNVGDGTWDFTKNDFLLPNLVGLNFDTMRYNGMGNRFSSVAQYHTLITGHAVIGIITFLFIIPISVMIVRFHNNRTGQAVRMHAYLNVIAVLLATVVLVTGWFAVGPHRSLTNPHHGIGVAIYTLVLLQIIGGRFVRHLAGRHSFRLTIHRWSGRTIAILGIVQVPLGLTLYGSPKALFVLYTLWMSFLLFVYFILSYRHEGRLHRDEYISGGRSDGPAKSSGGGMLRWLGPLAAGAGAWALLRGRKRERSPDRSRRQSRSRMDSRSRSRSYDRTEVISSRRGSESFVEEEKFNANRRKDSGNGFMNKLLAAGAAAGAGALLTNFLSNRKKKKSDEEYSAVATDTPSRPSRLSRPPPRRNTAPVSEVSYFTEDSRTNRTGSPTPGPRRHGAMGAAGAAAAGAAAGAAAAAIGNSYRHDNRPVTPRPSHQRTHSMHDPVDGSDYSSYHSPSRRTPPASGRVASAGKDLLGGMGLGWLASRFSRNKDTTAQDNERMRREEDERRAGAQGNRYTGDGYGSPVRRDRRSHRPAPSDTQTYSDFSESVIEQGGNRPGYAPVAAGAAAAGAAAGAAAAGSRPPAYAPVTPVANPRRSQSMSRSRQDVEPVAMPEMPPESDSDSILPQGRTQRSASRRRREEEALAAGAAGAAVGAAAGAVGRSSSRRREDDPRYAAYPPPSNIVKVKVPHDRAGNITLRRLTEAEAAAERGSSQQRRSHPSDEASSLSGTDSPSNRRYRRESSVRPAELSAERRTEASQAPPPPPQAQYQGAPHSSSGMLNPPKPPFAGGRRPKDSAYFSGAGGAPGAAGPSGSNPAAGHTMTSIDSPGSHVTGSAMSPSPGAGGNAQAPDAASSAAAERRRRRRLERSETGRQQTKVDYQ